MMKIHQIFNILIVLVCSLQAQNPPGTVELSSNLFIDIVPVDNLLMNEFLMHQEELSTQKIDSILMNSGSFGLDKSLFVNKYKNNKIVLLASIDSSENYLKNPAYSNYPVINISKTDAIEYCRWRSKAVMLRYATLSKTEEERTKLPKEVLYRLPTSKEIQAALKKFGYSKGKRPSNQKIPFLIYRNKYRKKYKKAIFLENNLSEFLFDNIAYGSNWNNSNHTEEPNDFTTFRCVCEIQE